MRVVAVPAGTGGVAFYRMLQPYGILKEQGHSIFIYDPIKYDMSRLQNEIDVADVIVYQGALAESIRDIIRINKQRCIESGNIKKIVCEYDDDFFSVNEFNEKYYVFGTKEVKISNDDPKFIDVFLKSHSRPQDKWMDIKVKNGVMECYMWRDGHKGLDIKANTAKIDALKSILEECDLLTVTTMALGSALREFRPTGPVAVLPNFIDFRRWLPMDENKSGGIRIGWQGGSAHFPDFQIIAKELIDLGLKNPDIKYVFKGVQYNLFNEIEHMVEWYPWHGCVNTHPLTIRHLAVDIGLCPLEDNKFNRGKSPLKWLEYSAMGIPSVVSEVVYGDFVEHEKTGLIAKKGEWFKNIERLVKDKDLRKEIAANAHAKVKKDFNEDCAKKWWKALEDLFKPEEILVKG